MTQDATGTQTDAKASEVVAPASDKQEVFTKEQVDAIRREMQGFKDRGIAEKEKWLNAGLLQIKQYQAEIASLQEERDELLTKAEGGPDIVAIKKKLKEKEAALEKGWSELNLDKLVHEEEKSKVNDFKRREKINEIAAEFKVKPEAISELNPRDEEQMRSFAKVIAAAATTQAPPPANVGAGGGKKSNEDILKEMYPTHYK